MNKGYLSPCKFRKCCQQHQIYAKLFIFTYFCIHVCNTKNGEYPCRRLYTMSLYKIDIMYFFMFITFLNIRVSQCGYCAQYFVPKYILKMACSDTEQH